MERRVEQGVGDGDRFVEVHVDALSVGANPDNVLETVFHQAKDAALYLRVLQFILGFLVGHEAQNHQPVAFEADVVVVALLGDGRDFASFADGFRQVGNEISLPVVEVVFIEPVSCVDEVDLIFFCKCVLQA